jgi:hypothetical protein
MTRVLALLTILALIVVPNCAPLCAGQNCGSARSSATQENCHHDGVSQATTQILSLSSCNLQELPIAVPAKSDLRFYRGRVRDAAFPLNLIGETQTVSFTDVKSSDPPINRASLIFATSVSVSNEILRI